MSAPLDDQRTRKITRPADRCAATKATINVIYATPVSGSSIHGHNYRFGGGAVSRDDDRAPQRAVSSSRPLSRE